MSDIEQLTEEQAQKALEEAYNSITDTSTVPVEAVKEKEKEAVAPTEKVEAPVVEDATKTAVPETKAKEDPYSWVAELPEGLREKVVAEINDKFQFKHQFESNKGRIAAFQQKLLEASRTAPVQNKQATPASQPAPAERQPPTTPEGWQEIVKSDPELAKAIEARVKSEVESAVGSVRGELQELRKTAIDPLYDHQSRQYVEAQRAELEHHVPNVNQVVASQEYRYWLDNVASEGIRNIALKSVNAGDAITVLRQYADDMIRLGYVKPPEQTAPATTTDTSQADSIAAAREAKLKAQTVVPSTPIAPTGGIAKGPVSADDAQKIFLEEYKKLMNKKT